METFNQFQPNVCNSQLFFPGNRFSYMGKLGTVKYLRDDDYEKSKRRTDSTHYYYSVDFDDGSFETYLGQYYMVHISS